MKFFYLENILSQELKTGVLPWDFVPTETLTEKIRHDKQERQAWYRNPNTRHNYYTGIEPLNPGQRCGKDNPPKFIHAFSADYDIKIPAARVDEAVAAMRLKPSWIEQSLGEKVRLIWLLDRPIPTESYAHCLFVLQQAEKWLSLGLLPSLDSGAFQDPSRFLCNGCVWRPTGHGAIVDPDLQSFIVACGKAFRFDPVTSGNDIPLDVVEKAIRDKFPSFAWPSDFLVDTQGPSWWVDGSTSAMSAIVKPQGMFTFSDHAQKPFYPWGDILGMDFVRQFADESMSKATLNLFYDGKDYWRKIKGVYKRCNDKDITNHLRVTCRLSSKPDKSGVSPVDNAVNHIHNESRVDGAGPFLFKPDGPMTFMNRPVLNISDTRVMKPAEQSGEFPFLDKYLRLLFVTDIQYDHWRAWFKYFYQSGLEQKPRPGQAIFLVGPAGMGKGLCSHEVIGRAMGGFTDASMFLVKGDNFGGENFNRPVLCIDDETPGGNAATHERFGAMLKKLVANLEHKYHMKFQVPIDIEFAGRAVVTLNLDYTSTRIMVSMDNSNMDKICIFKCCTDEKIKDILQNRDDIRSSIERDLPFYLRDLLEWTPPGHISRDGRFGFASYHDPELLDQSHQTSKSAPFKEILLEELAAYFESNKAATEWRGTVTQLYRLMIGNFYNEPILRKLNMDHINRYIEQIAREGLVKCSVETGDFKTRLWIIQRPEMTSKVLPIFSK